MLLCSCILLQIAHVIREIRLFQQTPYKIEHIPRVRRTFFFSKFEENHEFVICQNLDEYNA